MLFLLWFLEKKSTNWFFQFMLFIRPHIWYGSLSHRTIFWWFGSCDRFLSWLLLSRCPWCSGIDYICWMSIYLYGSKYLYRIYPHSVAWFFWFALLSTWHLALLFLIIEHLRNAFITSFVQGDLALLVKSLKSVDKRIETWYNFISIKKKFQRSGWKYE